MGISLFLELLVMLKTRNSLHPMLILLVIAHTHTLSSLNVVEYSRVGWIRGFSSGSM